MSESAKTLISVVAPPISWLLGAPLVAILIQIDQQSAMNIAIAIVWGVGQLDRIRLARIAKQSKSELDVVKVRLNSIEASESKPSFSIEVKSRGQETQNSDPQAKPDDQARTSQGERFGADQGDQGRVQANPSVNQGA